MHQETFVSSEVFLADVYLDFQENSILNQPTRVPLSFLYGKTRNLTGARMLYPFRE